MTLEEYKKRASEQEDWAPGWEAIDEVFDKLYPNQKPAHYGTDLHKRSIFGGDEYLDGYSIYQSPNGYKHLLTYGMTELYTDEESFGGEWSRWGYEMTIKLKEDSNEDCMWAINMLSNLARYTYTKKRFFEPMQFVAGNGTSLHIGVESAITALFIVNDTESEGIDTVHGRVEFMQLVGITQRELEVLKEDHAQAGVLVENMKKENPYLVTDMKREKSYL
ncbi:Suppressor of fused domain [Ruminiclostridium papyrosolvens DSM 2782]|uniref:Suppressor of fused domain n=1 Tax=Ruminiclostridium papyrosolvens DSM 2782 TaxID=588581 RepID=F1THF4_9FIRM|nr:suppressor of fused domain protein [Ruminiclostridium papyrosolvens]EGD46157.1 Suppressor of fused domain [Ruminiclostridium papyrosolvens DSM 2782]WES35940.1 suppressor of fused domain protein [Ruminiclostridium papyrosolvens DSM 2782]